MPRTVPLFPQDKELSPTPLEASKIDATLRIELDPLALEASALKPFRAFPARAPADLALGVDHAVPGHGGAVGEGTQGVSGQSRLPGQSRQACYLTVGRHTAPGNPLHDREDPLVKAGSPLPGILAGMLVFHFSNRLEG